MKKSFNFRPFNKWPKNKKVFDIISFVIYCPKHIQIAVNPYYSENSRAIGLPFIYLSSFIKIDTFINENLCLILSGGDSELMAKYKEVLPFDTNVSHVLSLRLRQFKYGFTRLMCFVRLHSDNPVLKCCQRNAYLDWYDKIDEYLNLIRNQNKSEYWDPKVPRFICSFDFYMNSIRNEYEIIQDYKQTSGTHYLKTKRSKMDLALLKYLNITEKDIHLFFIEFIEYCFPSVYMTSHSFKHFLKDRGLILPGCLIDEIMNYKNCLSFGKLLIALIYMDPHCPHSKSRIEFIFHYYYGCDEYIDDQDLRQMVEDIHRNESKEVIDGMVDDYMALKGPSFEGLTYNDFEKGVISGTIEGTDRLLRLKFPLFRRIGFGRKRVGPNVLKDEEFCCLKQ